ncbi:xylulokinase [uncultured Jatrophihabitans sp.]|uniref:xylulokinase n=1 Tax=uncultured Jatrophihabitans sp. TaxID=1610747 RepID=UPI0035CA43E1
MTLVAGVDSSTQSCKVVVRDAETGEMRRAGSAQHPPGTSVDPQAWWDALRSALEAAGGLDDVAALAVGGQQHGMVCLDESGAVVRDALLWNDTRSAGAAHDLVAELDGGAAAWASAVGSVPLASFTIAKLRWLARNEPDNAARTAAVCLPHDWLTWQLAGRGDLGELVTDRGDASGTGYWSPRENAYRTDLLRQAFGHEPQLPTVLGPADDAGRGPGDVVLGPGSGDNAAAALGLGAERGDAIVSLGTSGVVSAVSDIPTADPTGAIAGFADATGRFLPLVCTLNAAKVLDSTARLLGVSLDELSRLALGCPAGADGLVMVPYFDGERTPDRPDASAAVHGLRHDNTDAAHLARAAVEGMLCGLADGFDALRAAGVEVGRALLVGGGARSQAVREIAPAVLGIPVDVPDSDEYVAGGAARQAAWVLAGGERPPAWGRRATTRFEASPTPWVRERYGEVRELTARREPAGDR